MAIRRRHLEQRLDDHPERHVILVRGPAGAGKTILVAQWVAALGMPCVWLPIDPTHNDPDRLVWQLVDAAERLCPDSDDDAAGRTLPPVGADPGVVWDMLDAVGRGLGAPPVLVLDDVHHLRKRAALHVVGQLVERPPAAGRVVLIARRKPPIRLERARLRGDLVEITPSDLRFQRSDIEALAASWDDGHPDVTELEQATLGWAAGLRLAQLDATAGAGASSRPGSPGVSSEYVREELLGGSPDELSRFLEVSCWLPGLTEPLRAAVAGDDAGSRSSSWSDLEALPLMSVASDPGTLRYPPILARVLRQEVVARDASAASVARRRAAEACRQAGELVSAVDLFLQSGHAAAAAEVCADLAAGGESSLRPVHDLLRARPDSGLDGVRLLPWRIRAAVAAGDVDGAHQLLQRADGAVLATEGHDLVLARAVVAEHRGDVTALLAAADLLIERAADSPAAASSLRWALGRRARALVWSGELDAARAALRVLEHGAAGATPDAALDLALARAWVGWAAADMTATVQVATGRRESDDNVERAFLGGSMHRERNQLGKAVPLLQRAHAAAAAASHRVLTALAASELARCHRAAGAPADDLELVIATRAAFAAVPATVDAHLRSTDLRLRLDHGDTAAARLVAQGAQPGVDGQLLAARLALHVAPSEARVLLEGIDAETPRQSVEKLLLYAQLPDVEPADGSAALVAAISAGGHLGLVRTFLDEGPDVSRRLQALALESDDRVLGRLAALVTQELALTPAPGASKPVEPLTSRELAVLRMLPLRMSNREMAAQMYISVNTLKTHVRAIYRKLDVPHRSAAVRRAKALQLV